MMDSAEIKRLLEQGLAGAHVEVAGDGRHFQALVVSDQFEGAPLIRRHRMVNDVLRSYLDSEVLHAISLRTLTPEQWSAEQGEA